MSTHAITLAPYLESFDADTTADNTIINDVTSILEDVIPIMEHPSENFLSEVMKGRVLFSYLYLSVYRHILTFISSFRLQFRWRRN